MHHIHMSTPFFFVTVFGFIGLLAVIFAFVRSMRKDRLDAEREFAAIKAEEAWRAANPVRLTAEDIQRVHGERLEARAAVNGWPMRSASDTRPASIHNGYPVSPQVHSQGYVQPIATAAPVYAHDPMNGLVTGMLLGSALGGHSHSHDTTTIIHDNAPSHSHYSDSSSSYSSSSSDSGFSHSDSSSSSSDSSGGFDASW